MISLITSIRHIHTSLHNFLFMQKSPQRLPYPAICLRISQTPVARLGLPTSQEVTHLQGEVAEAKKIFSPSICCPHLYTKYGDLGIIKTI